MGELVRSCPKPLLKVNNSPVILHQINYMKQLGINNVIVVIGYLGEMIKKYLGDGSKYGMRIKYVKQEERLGIAHALGQLEELIDGPFMLFLGDIFFLPRDLSQMLKIFYQKNASAVLAVKLENNPQEIQKSFAVILHESGRVRRIIEKPRFIPTERKGCGIYLFDTIVFDMIRQTPRTAMRDEYEISTAVQKLIDSGYPVYDAEVIEWDINITFPEDLAKCDEEIMKRNIIT